MHIWLVNPFDPIPGDSLRPGRYAFLASVLTERGHKVTWLTSDFFHATKSYRAGPHLRTELDGNLRIVMLPTPAYGTNVGIRRIVNHVCYSHRLSQWASDQSDAPDLILASSPPLSSARAAVDIACRAGAKSVVDIQDLWPESFSLVLSARLSRPVTLAMRPLRRYADATYARADALVAINQALLDRALRAPGRNAPPSRVVVHLGVDLQSFDRCRGPLGGRSGCPEDDGLRITYVGTLGSAYDVATILRCAALSGAEMPDAHFIIIGSGPGLSKMNALAHQLRLENATFTGFITYERVVHLLAASDIAINAIAPGHKHAFPNKVFDYLAAGLPIINSATGELATLVLEEDIGRPYQAGQQQSLLAAVLELRRHPDLRRQMGRRSRQLAEERFDRNESYQKYVGFLENIANGRPPSHAP
jgi:glycosyltransferase involved in cell wall biosynthesis